MRTAFSRIALMVMVGASGAWAGGCASYDYGFRYTPRPAEARMAGEEGRSEERLTALASVVSVRRANPEAGEPGGVNVRMRFENDGRVPVDLNLASAALLDADLRSFGEARVGPNRRLALEAGEGKTMNVRFPFPETTAVEELNFKTLTLRWRLENERVAYSGTVTFKREERERNSRAWHYGQYHHYPHGGYHHRLYLHGHHW